MFHEKDPHEHMKREQDKGEEMAFVALLASGDKRDPDVLVSEARKYGKAWAKARVQSDQQFEEARRKREEQGKQEEPKNG